MRALVLVALGACAAPLPHAAHPVAPPIRVGIDHTQTSHGLATGYDDYIVAAVAELDHGSGVRWSMTVDPHAADVLIRHMPDIGDARCNTLGFHAMLDDAIYIEPACSAGGLALQATLEHELMHWAGAQHICRRPDELPDLNHLEESCSPVGVGAAILNPYAHEPEDTASCEGTAAGCEDVPRVELTDLDRAELARARRGRPPFHRRASGS